VATVSMTLVSINASFQAPPGTVPGNWQFSLTPATGTALTQAFPTASAGQVVTFSNVPDGVWSGSCARLDAAGNVIGTAIMSVPPSVTVVNEVIVSVPASLTVSVGP
jgi:hypothetical protein